MSINQIVTPLDSAVLENKEQYKIYFKIIKHAFNEFIEGITDHTICNEQEVTFIEQYCKLLLFSLETFRLKYLFDDEEKMRIDLTESGFPNFLEFRYLFNDLELKHEHINKLPKVEDLKAEFLETLVKRKEPISQRKLHQAASIVYYKSVDNTHVYKRFVQGKVIRLQAPMEAEYLVSWSFYDISLNRPFICFLYFDLYKEDLEDYTEKIYDVLEKVADRKISLDMMAYAIDKKLSKLLPKKLKVLDLGPLHTVFAKDDLQITHSILEAIINKDLELSSYALSISVHEIASKGEFSEGSFFNKQYLQFWDEPKRDKILLTSHRVLQLLYDKIPETIHSLSTEPIEVPALKL